MDVNKETPRNEITVQGVTLSAPAPYAEGHVLAENEAAVLNQTLAENLRNNFSRKVKAVVDEAGGEDNIDLNALQQEFDAYVAEYEFGVRRSGGGQPKLSPQEREARKIAKEAVKESIKEKGYKITDVPAAKITELADSLVEKDDFYMKEAKRRLDAAKKAAEQTIDLGDITSDSE